MIKCPTFLVIGVQKAATSWLWYCVEEHPSVFLPKKREVDYLGGEKYHKKGWDWWISRFADAQEGKAIGDVSVDYIYDKKAPRIIKERLGKPLFVISLRNPIDRAISAYFWNVRKGKIPNLEVNVGLRNALRYINEYSNDEEKVYSDIIRRGFYDEQIVEYLRYFDLSDFLFLSFGDIGRSPTAEIRKVYQFLGVDSEFLPNSLTRQPKRNTYLRFLIQLEQWGHASMLFSAFIDRINAVSYRLGLGRERPALTLDMKQRLVDVYRDHNHALIDILADYINAFDDGIDILADIEGWES